MATYYWVGGSGTWNNTSTTNWASSSGGAGGAGVPTSADDVVFDQNSDVAGAAFTVSGTTSSTTCGVCNNFTATGVSSAGGAAMTLGNARFHIYGSWANAATNFSINVNASLYFYATSSGKTITSNGVTFSNTVTFDGNGGGWTLGSALTLGTSGVFRLRAGDFATGNFAITAAQMHLYNDALSGAAQIARSFTAGSSTVTLTGGISLTTSFSSIVRTFDAYDTTNLTFSAGTSSFVMGSTNPYLRAGPGYSTGLTFYNVSFTGSVNYAFVIGNNTYNSFTFTRRSSAGTAFINFGGDQTFNAGTNALVIGNASTANFRILFRSMLPDRTVTLTTASRGTMADIDFQKITIAGAAGTLTGTRIGDAGGNSNITATASRTVYWSLAAGGTWQTSTCWATTSGGAPALNNYPLPQDTVVINNTNLNSGAGITVGASGAYVLMPTISASTRTNNMSFTLATAVTANGDITFGSGLLSMAGAQILYCTKLGGTQTITTPAIAMAYAIVTNGTATVKLSGPTGVGGLGIQAGTFDLNGSDLVIDNTVNLLNAQGTANGFSIQNIMFDPNVYAAKSIVFGTNKITSSYIGPDAYLDYSGFSCTGTPNLEFTAVTSTATLNSFNATISENNALAPSSEAYAINVTAAGSGSGNITQSGLSPLYIGNFDCTSFTGSGTFSGTFYPYGNITFNSSMSPTSCQLRTSSSSNTQTYTPNGRTIQRLYILNTGTGKTVLGGAAIASDVLRMTSGTFDLNGYNMTALTLSISTSATKSIVMGSQTLTLTASSVGSYAVQSSTSTSPGSNLTFSGLSTGTIQTRGFAIFEGGGMSYPTWDFYNTATPNPDIPILGSNTFYDIKNAASSYATTYTYRFAAGSTNTFTNWSLNGSSTLPVLIRSSVAGSQATLSKSSGTVTVTYFDIQDSNATGGASWVATSPTNTNSGNNTGWIFVATGASNFFMFM